MSTGPRLFSLIAVLSICVPVLAEEDLSTAAHLRVDGHFGGSEGWARFGAPGRNAGDQLSPATPDESLIRRCELGTAERSHSILQVGISPDIRDDDQTWVLVAPYVWTPAMRGTIGARGVTVPIDMSLSDLYDILFDDLNGAAMAHVEVGKGNVGLLFDGMLVSLGPSEPGPLGGKINLDVGATILESMVIGRLIDIETDMAPDGHFSFDLLAGGRYYQVQNEIRINPVIGPSVQADLSKDWVDIVFGARTAFTLLPGLDGFLRADVGGFGIGTSSKLAWNLNTGVSWNLASHPGTSVVLGYRILDINETQDSGPQQFVFDVTMHGPFAALSFAF